MCEDTNVEESLRERIRELEAEIAHRSKKEEESEFWRRRIASENAMRERNATDQINRLEQERHEGKRYG